MSELPSLDGSLVVGGFIASGIPLSMLNIDGGGFLIGRVSAVRTSADGTVRATVTPTASPTQVDLVGIVVGDEPGTAISGPRSVVTPR